MRRVRILSAWRIMRNIAVAASAFALSACAATSFNYVQPYDLTQQTGATIIGSTTLNPDPAAPDTHVYLGEIDNLQTKMGWRDWNKPVLVAPGTHLLTLESCYCNWLENYAGGVTLAGNFEAGKTYTLNSTRAKGFGPFWSANLWIADASGTAITPKTGAQFGPPGGGTVVIPIFIPAR